MNCTKGALKEIFKKNRDFPKKWKVHILMLLAISSFLFFTSCDKNKNLSHQKIDSLITSSDFSKADKILKKHLDKNPDSPSTIFQLANVYAAQSFQISDSLAAFSDSLKVLATSQYRKLFSSDSLSKEAYLYCGLLYFQTGNLESSFHYFNRFYQVDSLDARNLSFLLCVSLNQRKWTLANYVGRVLQPRMSKWFLLESLKNRELPEQKTIIVTSDNCKASDGKSSDKVLKKYDLLEYSGEDFSHFLIKNIRIGWIPNDKAWFRGIFEKRDYSNEGNIYTAPNGSYRIGKRYVVPGSVRFLRERATSESGLGIVKSGWSKVSFEINIPLKIDKTNVVVGFGDRKDEEKRIEKLKHIDFLSDEQKVRLLESLIFKGMPLSLFKIAIPASKQKKYHPLMKRIIQIYQYKNVRFVFEDGFLVSWSKNLKIE